MFVPQRKRRCLLLQVQQQVLPLTQQEQDPRQPEPQPNSSPLGGSEPVPEPPQVAEIRPLAHPCASVPQWHRDGKKSHRCRVCGLQLSSASNRLRHERAKHKHQVLGPPQPVRKEPTVEVIEPDLQPQDSDQDSETAGDESEEQLTADAAQSFASGVEGFRPLLQETELQASCFPFLQWLSLPPLTACEALVKARRVKSLNQLQPIKSNLRFIFAVLYEKELIESIDLKDLSKLPTCQALFDALSQRNVGSARFHAVFLLVKKVLVYLTSQESTSRGQFLQPTMHESFMYVDGICSDSSYRRKQEARNRAVLGVQASQALTKTQPPRPPEAFQVPTVWSSSPATASPSSVNRPMPAAAVQTASFPTPTASSAPTDELGKAELQLVAKGCLSYLTAQRSPQVEAANALAVGADNRSLDRLYMAHLVTATLCLGLAPRSQVLKQLRIGSTFVKEASDGRYWVKMLADMSKNGKPTTFSIPPQLTAAFDYYIATVRPRLLAATESAHDYVFVKHNGSAPRSDYSSCTTLVTQRLIGRPINAHAFRAAVITAFYEAGASQSEMDTLASIMAHDPTTARNFYFRPQFGQAAVQAGEKMSDLLLHESEASPAAATAAAATKDSVAIELAPPQIESTLESV